MYCPYCGSSGVIIIAEGHYVITAKCDLERKGACGHYFQVTDITNNVDVKSDKA